MHLAERVPLGHFLVDDPTAGRHPLDVAGGDAALVAQAVAVLDRAGQHISDSLDAAMRMPRKAGQVILRDVVAEIVQQQERIELGGVAETESAAQTHARAFQRRFGLAKSSNGS